MLSRQEIRDLIGQARRNEEILRRLDQVESFLLAHHGFQDFLVRLGPKVAKVYALDRVTLTLVAENRRLGVALAAGDEEEPSPEVILRQKKELRLLLADLERPYLGNHMTRDLMECFFPQDSGLASLAVLPLWVRGEMLGTLNLGSRERHRYSPDYDTHFLERLARKAALGLDAALLMEQTRQMERSQAAVEMAGAACHELAQPLQTIGLLVEKLMRAAPSDEFQGLVAQMEDETDRASKLVLRISQVSRHVTRPYAQGLNIVDLQAAGDHAGDRMTK